MSRKKLSTFAKFRRRYKLSVAEAAAQFEVTMQTIRNWQYREPPRWVMRMIELQERQLSGIHPDWQGFKIGWNGRLYGPHGFSTTARHMRQEALTLALAGRLAKTPAEPVASERDCGGPAPQS